MSLIQADCRIWLRCLIALTAEVFGTWLTNVYLYPHYIGIAPEARDISSALAVITLAILALVAMNKPTSIHEKTLTPISLTLYSFGFMLILLGLWQANPAILILGASIRSIGSRWIVVLAGISLCLLQRRDCMLCIASAFGLSYLLRIPFAFVGSDIAIVVLISLMFVMYAACRPLAIRVLEDMQTALAGREASITEPDSYLPFAHAFFVAIFVFRIAYGFALTFESVDGIPQTTMLGLIPIVLLLVLALKSGNRRAGILYEAAALLIVAGYLFIIVLHGRVVVGYPSLVDGCLFAGSECFEVLVWFALSAIGARNPSNALAVFAWGRAASSFGLLCGANFGHWANALPDNLETSVLVAGVLFCFMAVNLTVLKGFSFQDTIDGVQPVKAVRIALYPDDTSEGQRKEEIADRTPAEVEQEHTTTRALSDALTASCDGMAQKYHLTPREREVLGMLAHGRNAPYIQEKLVLSRNTIKTHVQNIYAKLGVHSQQELIDSVELFGEHQS